MRKATTPSSPKKPLRNARREKFAQAVARGLPAAQAYIEAGYRVTGHVAEANGSRLWKNIEVAARIEALCGVLTERFIEKTAITMADIDAEFRKMAFADMSLDNHGLTYNGKIKSLLAMGNHRGGFVPRKELDVPSDISRMTDGQLDDYIAQEQGEPGDSAARKEPPPGSKGSRRKPY
jgi:Terminase small subunit